MQRTNAFLLMPRRSPRHKRMTRIGRKNWLSRKRHRRRSDRAQDQATSANAVAAARADADQSRSAAQLSDQRAQSAENDKAAMRARLEQQLNSILQTRDSARGLIVSMSDVLFDTGKYTLLPGAREKLAKVAGILLAYPGLNIAVGGYTDNVGNNQYQPDTL